METKIENTSVTFNPIDKLTIVALAKAIQENAKAIQAVANMAKPNGNSYGIYIDGNSDN